VEVEQEEAQMNKQPKRRRLNLFSQILPAPLHQCSGSLFVLQDKVQKRFQLRSWLTALLLTTSDGMKRFSLKWI
jgi:hypothetical protein